MLPRGGLHARSPRASAICTGPLAKSVRPTSEPCTGHDVLVALDFEVLLPIRAITMKGEVAAMTEKNDDLATAAAFLLTLDSIREAIKDLQGWDACLALTICLSECVVY